MKHFVLSLCLVLMSMFANGQNYNVVDLGVLPTGTFSGGQAINQSGQVAGYADNGSRTHAALFSGGTVLDLGTLPTGLISFANGINQSGQMTGYSEQPGNFSAFLYTGGTMQDLGPLLRSTSSSGQAINQSGQVTGVAFFYDVNASHAFLYSLSGGGINLGTLPGGNFSWGYAINQSGQVTGMSTSSAPYSHAFLFSNGVMADLGALGSLEQSQGNGISDDGKVVGFSTLNNLTAEHAVLFSGGVVIDLGVLGYFSSAAAINPSGIQAVGIGDVPPDPKHALLFNHLGVTGTTVQDLNTLIPANSGWVLYGANGVNDAGQITGFGLINGAQHAFRLDPIPYKAFIQQPINPDGSSIFSGSRGVVPVKFTLTQNNTPTCTLPAAAIALTRTAGGTVGTVDESTYVANADSGSNFRIDPTACQYVYNLAAKSLGVGVYRVDIAINGSVVGSGVFALK